MTVTVVTEDNEPEPDPVIVVEDAGGTEEIVAGAADLAGQVIDAAEVAAEQARAEAFDVEALRVQIRAEVEAELATRQAEIDAAVAVALAEAAPEPEPEDTSDTIAPSRTHPWFRSPAEWFGGGQ